MRAEECRVSFLTACWVGAGAVQMVRSGTRGPLERCMEEDHPDHALMPAPYVATTLLAGQGEGAAGAAGAVQ